MASFAPGLLHLRSRGRTSWEMSCGHEGVQEWAEDASLWLVATRKNNEVLKLYVANKQSSWSVLVFSDVAMVPFQ